MGRRLLDLQYGSNTKGKDFADREQFRCRIVRNNYQLDSCGCVEENIIECKRTTVLFHGQVCKIL